GPPAGKGCPDPGGPRTWPGPATPCSPWPRTRCPPSRPRCRPARLRPGASRRPGRRGARGHRKAPAGRTRRPRARRPPPRTSPRGLPSPERARVRSPMALTVGLDVGGTKVAAGVVNGRGAIVEKLKRSTPAAEPSRTAQVVARVVPDRRARPRVRAVGRGAAGFVTSARAAVMSAPTLAWRDEPLKQRVEDLVGLPVVMDNDANASAWAEVRFGA